MKLGFSSSSWSHILLKNILTCPATKIPKKDWIKTFLFNSTEWFWKNEPCQNSRPNVPLSWHLLWAEGIVCCVCVCVTESGCDSSLRLNLIVCVPGAGKTRGPTQVEHTHSWSQHPHEGQGHEGFNMAWLLTHTMNLQHIFFSGCLVLLH